MQKIIVLLLLLLPATLVYSQTAGCSAFREGKFRIADATAGGITLIERNDKYQIESNEESKITIRLLVTWLDECSYELKFDKFLRNENNIEVPKVTMLVKIIETRKESYIQETTSPLFAGVYRSEVVKIK